MIIVALGVLTAVLLALGVWGERNDREWALMAGGLLAIFVGIGFFISIIALPITRLEVRAEMAQFIQTQATITAARAEFSVDPVELAAIQHKIVEMNEWLAETKFYASNPWLAPYYPKEVLKLEMIK